MSARLRPAVVVVAALVSALATACGKSASDERSAPTTRKPPVATGSIAPAYTDTALTGAAVAFGGATSELTLVNVWATWCRSCKEEFAELERIRLAHEGQGLHVVAVSVDQGGSAKVQNFVAAQGSRFPVVHDKKARISSEYGVSGLPSTYLIGRDGRVLWSLTGSFLEDSAAMYAAIRKAVAAP